jgi:hypothetical protein
MVLTSGGRHHHPRSVLVCSWPDGSSSLPPSPSLPTRYFNPLDPSRLHPREAAIASFESSSTSETPIGPQSLLIHLFPSSYPVFNPILGVTNSKSSELLTLLAGAQHQVTPRQTTLLHSWWLAASSSTAFPRTPAAAHRVVVGSSRHSRHKDNPDSSIGRAIILCPVQA